MKKSNSNLSVIENFILHITHSSKPEDGVDEYFEKELTTTPKILYKMAKEYIKEDHVDGEDNPYDDVISYKAETCIFTQLKKVYSDSFVTSGEFYQYIEISLGYDEEQVREGIQAFLDWDKSTAKFKLEKGSIFWKIKDL